MHVMSHSTVKCVFFVHTAFTQQYIHITCTSHANHMHGVYWTNGH